MTDEIHNHSRVDEFQAARRRAMVLHSLWRPMLAGAAGAALVITAVYVTLPKFSVREVEVDHVIPRDVPNIITKDVEIAIPRIVAVTPTEKRFLDSREYQAAPMHGRIVSPRSERALSFDDGSDYTPTLPDMAADAGPYVGLWGYCAPTADKTIFHCFALLHDGTVISVPQRPAGRPR